MYIGDDPRVFEVDQGIVDKEAASRGRVEDVEVRILDPNAVEVGGGKCSGVKRGRVFAVALASYSYKVSVLSNTPIRDIPSRLRLSFLIEENDGVEVGLSSVISYPPFSRMVGILEITSEGRGKPDGFGRGSGPSDSGVVLGEADRFVRVYAVVVHVGIDEIYDAGNKEEVLYRFEIAVSGLEGFVVEPIVA